MYVILNGSYGKQTHLQKYNANEQKGYAIKPDVGGVDGGRQDRLGPDGGDAGQRGAGVFRRIVSAFPFSMNCSLHIVGRQVK